MREMRLSKREVKDPMALRQIVEDCDVVRIGAVDEEGMFIVPVNFGYEMMEGEGVTVLKLYFHSASQGRKAEAFRKSPEVAIEMDCSHELIRGSYSCSYSYGFRSIMGNGVVRGITRNDEKLHALKLLMEHTGAPEAVTFSEDAVDRVNVYCIEVKSFTGKMRTSD